MKIQFWTPYKENQIDILDIDESDEKRLKSALEWSKKSWEKAKEYGGIECPIL